MKKLIKFYSDSCAPCKILKPIVDKIIENHPELEYEEYNCSEEVPTQWAQEIRSVPTLIVVEKDKPNKKLVGLKTYEVIEKFIFDED